MPNHSKTEKRQPRSRLAALRQMRIPHCDMKNVLRGLWLCQPMIKVVLGAGAFEGVRPERTL